MRKESLGRRNTALEFFSQHTVCFFFFMFVAGFFLGLKSYQIERRIIVILYRLIY